MQSEDFWYQPARWRTTVRAAHHTFSKKFENHVHMVELYKVWYNLAKVHKGIGCRLRWRPALWIGSWSMGSIAALVEAAAPKPEPRGPNKKRLATA
jgi:hypothetical protein